jgi:hypothetical protein
MFWLPEPCAPLGRGLEEADLSPTTVFSSHQLMTHMWFVMHQPHAGNPKSNPGKASLMATASFLGPLFSALSLLGAGGCAVLRLERRDWRAWPSAAGKAAETTDSYPASLCPTQGQRKVAHPPSSPLNELCSWTSGLTVLEAVSSREQNT